MNYQLIFFIFIIQISLFTSLPSDDLWIKIKNYINQGKMIVNKNKTHFFFDELNCTKLDINSTKMQALYKRQEQIYKDFNLSTYIIIVDNFDESIETMHNAEERLGTFLRKEFNIYWINIFIIFISVKTRKIVFGNNDLWKRFPLLRDQIIEKHMDDNLKEQKYYEAWIFLIDEFIPFWN